MKEHTTKTTAYKNKPEPKRNLSDLVDKILVDEELGKEIEDDSKVVKRTGKLRSRQPRNRGENVEHTEEGITRDDDTFQGVASAQVKIARHSERKSKRRSSKERSNPSSPKVVSRADERIEAPLDH
jgi:hypothetical protein